MEEGHRLRKSIYLTLVFLAVIWMVKIIETTCQMDFGEYGILPRTLSGTVGIVTAPLIHGDIYHLLSNSFPLLILGVTFFYFYDRIALIVLLLIYLMTGFWVWIAAREGYYHIGASGVIYGMLSFLLCSGFLRRDRKTLAISLIILLFYGSTFFLGMFPADQHISWESHLMGAIAGIFCAVYFKTFPLSDDPASPIVSTQLPPTYHYEYTTKKPEEKTPANYTIRYTPDDKSNGK